MTIVDAVRLRASDTRPARPRLGHISFLNSYPHYWSFARSGLLSDVRLRRDSPERLSDALVAGELDISPISVVEYLRHSDRLLLLPGLAIGCDGPVLSCNLVSRVPLARLDGRPVALGATSRTTVELAKLLLEERLGVRPVYHPSPPDADHMLATADAGVLIGDPALRVHLTDRPGVDVHDTGALWKAWTGLPMVFAVWAVTREFAAHSAWMVAAVHREILAARDHATQNIDEVAHHAAHWEPFTAPQLAHYFRTLSYDLTPRHTRGLAEFARRTAARGTVPATQRFEYFTALG